MSAMFTEEERERIRCQLVQIGYEIFESSTLKKTSVAEIARRCGIAKGSFYNFYPSKHAFAVALMQDATKEKMTELSDMVREHGKVPLEKFMPWYRSFFTEEVNFYFRLKVEDVLWLRDNMEDNSIYDPETDKRATKAILDQVDGIREDVDYGVLTNFNKMIYAMAQNRDTFCQEAIPENIDLIMDMMYRYMRK